MRIGHTTCTLLLSGHAYATGRARIEISCLPPLRRDKRGTNFLERRPGESRDSMRNTIVPVFRVAPEITVEPIAHVQELLGDHHLN